MAEPVVQVSGVTRRFGATTALDSVNLAVERGVVHGLVGANGAGKTTLIRHVLGLLRPQTGRVRVFGMDPVADPVAVLARLGAHVVTIEIDQSLAEEARDRLAPLRNITFGIGDGHLGWPDLGLFDRIVVTGGTEIIPEALLHQLQPGGRLVVPAGLPRAQRLMLVDRSLDSHLHATELMPVRFAPLVELDDASVEPLL